MQQFIVSASDRSVRTNKSGLVQSIDTLFSEGFFEVVVRREDPEEHRFSESIENQNDRLEYLEMLDEEPSLFEP